VLEKPLRYSELFNALSNTYGSREPEPASRAEPDCAAVRQQGLNILLAEDNQINQQYALAVLAKGGHQVTLAENGRQALEAATQGDFDLILMDVQMPEMDGVEATRRIRALPAPRGAVPIFAMTAHAMNGVSDEYLAAGMSDYIPKPFQPQVLLNKIQGLRTSQPVKPSIPGRPDSAEVTDIGTHLQGMLEILSQDQVNSIVALYLQATEGHLASIAACHAAGDIAGLTAQAHILVSLAGNVGAGHASQAARDLEHGCRDGAAADHISERVSRLTAEILSSAAALRAWRAGPPQARAKA